MRGGFRGLFPGPGMGGMHHKAVPMLISYEHEFIFIHCRKTGGSSIMTRLAPCLGPDDILTGGWREAVRQGIAPNRRAWIDFIDTAEGWRSLQALPRNFDSHIPVSQLLKAVSRATGTRLRPYFDTDPAHPSAREIRDFDPDAWNRFFKFCFVRNPYERVVSDYLWRRHVETEAFSFSDFLEDMTRPPRDRRFAHVNADNWDMYTLNDEIAVDAVGRFENLNQDFSAILDRIGLYRPDDSMPHVKKSGTYDYRSFYTEEAVETVSSLFRKEIACFGYCF